MSHSNAQRTVNVPLVYVPGANLEILERGGMRMKETF